MKKTLPDFRYGSKTQIAQAFGVNVNTLGSDLTAMRRLPDFADYILRVSHKRVYISYDGYEAYLKYKAQKWTQ